MYFIRTKPNPAATSTNWNGITWSNGLPTAVKDAYIDANFNTANGSFSCRDLILTSSTVLTVATDSHLKILRNIHQSPESKIVVKDKGNLMLLYKNAATDNLKLQIDAIFPNKKRFDYEFLSPPISGLTLKSISPGTLNDRFYTYNEPENGYTTLNPNTTITQAGRGYMIRVPDNFPTSSSNWEMSINNFTPATVNKSYIPYLLSHLNVGINMVGNPYTASLSLKKLCFANNKIIERVFFWKKTNGAQGSSYISYNYFTSNMSSEFKKISSYQGFLVSQKIPSHLNEIVFTPDMMLPSEDYSMPDRFYINIKQVGIFHPIGGFCFDVKKFPIPFPDVFNDGAISITENGNKIICRRETFDTSNVLNLRVLVTVNSNYIITLKEFSGLFQDIQHILLIDQLLGLTHNLKLSDYLFSSAAGEFTDRFKIVFQPE